MFDWVIIIMAVWAIISVLALMAISTTLTRSFQQKTKSTWLQTHSWWVSIPVSMMIVGVINLGIYWMFTPAKQGSIKAAPGTAPGTAPTTGTTLNETLRITLFYKFMITLLADLFKLMSGVSAK